MVFSFDTLIGSMDDMTEEQTQRQEKRQTSERSKRIRDIAIDEKAARDMSVVSDQAEAARAATRLGAAVALRNRWPASFGPLSHNNTDTAKALRR